MPLPGCLVQASLLFWFEKWLLRVNWSFHEKVPWREVGCREWLWAVVHKLSVLSLSLHLLLTCSLVTCPNTTSYSWVSHSVSRAKSSVSGPRTVISKTFQYLSHIRLPCPSGLFTEAWERNIPSAFFWLTALSFKMAQVSSPLDGLVDSISFLQCPRREAHLHAPVSLCSSLAHGTHHTALVSD